MRKADRIFLTGHVLKWGLGALIVALLLCRCLFGNVGTHAELIIILVGYAAVFPGFFGGLLRMFRREA